MKWAPRGGVRGRGRKGKPMSAVRLAIQAASLGALLYATLVPIIAGQFCQVNLPKLGMVRATWLQTLTSPQVPLAAFLGLPYAAPPVGPLRFMPPGAPTKSSRSASQLLERHQLADSGQSVEVRSHDRFGPACVNLEDWITDKDETKQSQSEDCLLANVFVPVPETKWRLYTGSNRQQSVNQSNQGFHLWPLPVAASRLAVLLLVHGEQSSANSQQNISLPYLELARETILVTFGYRQGLLGFLPLATTDSGTISNSKATRSNHAIWDHVALLHWLRHNVIHFGGDPTNISLQAVDNKASRLLHLLALSPMSKGLFRRLILVRDERSSSTDDAILGHSLPSEARDLRLGLNLALKQAVTQLQDNYTKELASSDVFDFLQTANLTQLVQLERQLKQLLPTKVLAFALGPSLDDKHLFPYSSTVARQLELFQPPTTTTSNINYLIYVRHLRLHPTNDQLGLLQAGRGYVNNSSESQRLPAGWYRSSSNLSSHNYQLDSQNYTSRRRENLSTIVSHFEHLRALNLLVRHLSNLHSEKLPSPVYHQPEMLDSKSSHNKAREQAQNLYSQLNSFDLLIGHYVQSNSDTQPERKEFNGTFNNIINVILENCNTFNREMLIWLKFSDLHWSANMAVNSDKSSEPETKNRQSSTYVFFNRQVASKGESVDWLKDAFGQQSLLSNLHNFIKSGNPNADDWPNYNPYERPIKKYEITDEEIDSIQNQATIYLDIIPYLVQPPQIWRDHRDLYACLAELNSTIVLKRTNLNQTLTLKCLLSEMEKLKVTIRQLAYHDLDPIQQQLRTQQETSMSTQNVALNDNLLIDPEVMTSDSMPVSGLIESSEGHHGKSKQLMRNVDEEVLGVVGSAINFVKQRPLMVVITTGLIIFIMNLAIVLVITIRTRKKRRVVDCISKTELDIQPTNQKPSSQCPVERLAFGFTNGSSSNAAYNQQLVLLEPPVLNNHIPVQDQEGFMIGSSFASQSTYSNSSITNIHPQLNILGPIFHSPCTSYDTCTLTPVQNNSNQQELLPTNQLNSGEMSEMVLCTTSQDLSVEPQQSTDLLILGPYPDHFFTNHQV